MKKIVLRVSALTMALAAAQAVYANEARPWEVPAGDLVTALEILARQADIELVYDAQQLRGMTTGGVTGEMTPDRALVQLLEGTSLSTAMQGGGTRVIAAAPAPTGQAQASSDVPAGEAAKEASAQTTNLDRVMVTGSRLLQMGSDSIIPLKQVNREELIESGQMDLVDTLRDVPGVSGNDMLTGNQTSFQGNGLSTISLRGLGLARTLVLIDGRRTVSNAGNRNVVSLSSVPEYMLDRVEVLTGGASAVYGSDAIAGVVNIITQDKMDGFRARTVIRGTEEGGGGSTEYSIGGGSRFLDDRLYVMGAVTYSDQRPLYARDRDWAMVSASFSATNNVLSSPALNAYIPGGRFVGSGFFFDEEGMHRGFVTSVNGYDQRGPGFLITPREMINAGAKLNFDVSPDMQFYSSAMYSVVDTVMAFDAASSAYNIAYGQDGEFVVGNIPRNSPFVPTEIRNAVGAAGVTWFRRMNELGDRVLDNNRVTRRFSAGLRGTNGNWDWDVSYGYGDFDGYQISYNYIHLDHLKEAINATTIDGAVVCANPVARAAGCVPVNLFGVGSISPEGADYIRSNMEFWARNRQHTFEASMSGSPFSLPAGPVPMAFGIEWRRDQTSSRTDELTQQGISSAPYIPTFGGTISTRSAYVESRLPLLRNAPFAQDLSLELALRVNNYPELGNVGTTFSYRTGVQWTVTESLMFRAAYGLAQRAPYTTELYSPPRDGRSTVVDICRDVTAATSGIVAENCRSDPRIAAAIAENGKFVQDTTTVFTPASGNVGLKEETAHTFTAGFIFSPWKGMDASIDYYDIKIRDAITSISFPSLLNECYSDPGGIDNQFCAQITRDAQGQLTRIDDQLHNLDTMRASGIDVAFKQGFDLQRFGMPGKFTFNGSYSRRIRLETLFQGATGIATTNFRGGIGYFTNEAKVGLTWSKNPVRIRWSAAYLGEAVDSNARRDLFESLGTVDPLFLYVPSFVRHDLNVSLSPMQVGNSDAKWRLFANILNVFDRMGPYLPDGTASGNRYNYNGAYGVTGRTYSLGIEVRM